MHFYRTIISLYFEGGMKKIKLVPPPDVFYYNFYSQQGNFAEFSRMTEFAGPIGNKVWVVVQDPIRSYLYDFTSHTSEPFPMGDRFIEENKMRGISVPVQALLPYQNDIYYIQKSYFRAEENGFPFSKITILSFSSGQTERFPFNGVMHAISLDKKNLLIDVYENMDLTL